MSLASRMKSITLLGRDLYRLFDKTGQFIY